MKVLSFAVQGVAALFKQQKDEVSSIVNRKPQVPLLTRTGTSLWTGLIFIFDLK
jgi:hypothetical protein